MEGNIHYPFRSESVLKLISVRDAPVNGTTTIAVIGKERAV